MSTDNVKPWMTYSLAEENVNRNKSRKLLNITSILKELGYPIRLCFLMSGIPTLNQLVGIDDKEKSDIGIIEFLPVTDDIKKEIKSILVERGIKIKSIMDYQYDDAAKATRFYVSISTIKG